ncbi:conserved protein, unknown function, partial [Hepatocystis sp. ex Piliocolobus tephrosceles]
IVRILIVIVNTLLIFCLLLDITKSCERHLRTWILGSLILSIFLFGSVERIQKMIKEDKGFFYEVVLMLLSFLWTYFGTIQINKSDTCQKTAPHLFWAVFTLVTTIWCSIIGLILSLIIISIGSLFVVLSNIN